MPTSSKPGQKTAMISSTSLDLPEHRKQVEEACLRQGFHPIAMEHLPARDAGPIVVDAEMLAQADVYIGIYAWRYGEVPKGHDISYTEMEFNRAVELGTPILIFLMHEDHPVKPRDVEADAAAQKKLAEFKQRASAGRIRKEFRSPDNLRGLVIESLADLKAHEQQASGQTPVPSFHRHYDIPQPPEPFIAHPYTLLQTHRLVGRQAELNLLTDWVAKPQSQVYSARILNVVAIGGMGKSALTWKWFTEIAPLEMKPLAGRMWWSFYESDATFENFVTRALAYTTRRPLAEVEQIPAPDREAQLLAALDREPFLIVLDGLERMLIAYARMDAAHLSDDEFDKQTANYVANAYGLPESAAQSFIGQNLLRKTADPRAGSFLRKLANVAASKILVSTRLYPADLQSKVNGSPINGCFALFLPGLSDDDALELWRAFEVSGARDHLLPLFNRVENHSLLIQALAAQVARYRPAPGDFERWRQDHPDFDPFSLPLVQVKSHVLEFALRGLGEQVRQALQTIAAFRMPASYDTLTALLVGEAKPCAGERELGVALDELEDRGLLGWDKHANRYDLHPIVRGVVWSGLDDDARRGVYTKLHAHFEALPAIDEDEVNRLEDLMPTIELYNTLVGLGRYDDALTILEERMSSLIYRLSAAQKMAELIEMLFPTGIEREPHLPQERQRVAFLYLGLAYQFIGQPERAVTQYSRAETSYTGLALALSLRLSGKLCRAETLLRQALLFFLQSSKSDVEQALSLLWLGLVLASRGEIIGAEICNQRALRIFNKTSNDGGKEHVQFHLSQLSLWIGNPMVASSLAETIRKPRAVKLLSIPATRVQGSARLALNDFTKAEGLLINSLTNARAVNLVEEELPALIGLAELRRRQGKPDEAREFLNDFGEAAERGPYPLFHADACNVLVQIERDAGNTPLAIEAATQAYRLAWCDGPPYAYHWGLEAARKHLRELGAPEPQLPPFDPSKFEPMPDVEINPKDEFYVEISKAER